MSRIRAQNFCGIAGGDVHERLFGLMMSETNQLVMKTLSRREKPRTWGQELRSVGEAGESGDPTCLQVTAEPQIQGAQIQLPDTITSWAAVHAGQCSVPSYGACRVERIDCGVCD